MASSEVTISIRYTGNFHRKGNRVHVEFELDGKPYWTSNKLREEYQALSDSEIGQMLTRLWDEQRGTKVNGDPWCSRS